MLLAADPQAGKVLILAALTKDLVKRGVHAGKWVAHVAPQVGGRGGGKPDLAQAGGKMPDAVPQAIEAGRDWIRSALGASDG
jgi:alanyl-tRNA synthetase